MSLDALAAVRLAEQVAHAEIEGAYWRFSRGPSGRLASRGAYERREAARNILAAAAEVARERA